MELNLNGYRVLLLPRPLGQNYVHADLATGSKGNHDNVHADPSVNRPFLSSARRPCFRLTSGVSGLEAHWRGEWLSGGRRGDQEGQQGFLRTPNPGFLVRSPGVASGFHFHLLLFFSLPFFCCCSSPRLNSLPPFLPLPRRCCQKA